MGAVSEVAAKRPTRTERPRPKRRRLPKKSAAMVLTTALAIMVLVAVGSTWFGVGVASRALKINDGEVWLWSRSSGEAQRVNVHSGEVDTRRALTDARGHDVAVAQTDKHLILHDRTDGVVTAVDLATLNTTAKRTVAPGENTNVVLWQDKMLLVNSKAGSVAQLNPDTLQPTGKPASVGGTFLAGDFDDTGTFWLVKPGDGELVGLRASDGSPRAEQKSKVAAPNHDLVMTTLDKGAAVIDTTDDVMVTLINNQKTTVKLPGLESVRISPRTHGDTVAITQPTQREVILVKGTSVSRHQVPG
ncbi:MAG TPA: hypothetical protein VHU91_07030, partial [Mycobacteriales bacterium]|nr:hypothetical protein [Mycobacteriales bacterium]